MLSPLKNVPFSYFHQNNMEFFPQDGHMNIDRVIPPDVQWQNSPGFKPQSCRGPVRTNSVFASTGIISHSHHSKNNMASNAHGNHISVDKAPSHTIQDRAPQPDRTTELPANLLQSNGSLEWQAEKERTILGPYNYIASEPGKELRTMLLRTFNVWLRVPENSLQVITKVVRMLHTASLLIDDIQDNSQLRRGKPVAHKIYGIAQTINSGNYVYFQALEELYKLNSPAKAIEIYTAELLHLHRGQGMDLWWRDTLTCPTVEEYLEMVSNKTGGLFRLAIRLMQVESPRNIDCVPLVDLMGLIFQVVDDYKNLSDIDYTAKKGVCEDLTEGKFSFPVIHSINADPQNTQLLHILAQRSEDIEVKKTAVKYIESTGSLEYTKEYVGKLTILAKEEAAILSNGNGGSEEIRALLDLITI